MRSLCLGAIGAFCFAGALPALAQDDETPPIIESLSLEIGRNMGVTPYGPFEPLVPFNPATELAREGDWIRITVVVTDNDLPENSDSIFVRKTSVWLPLVTSPAPEPPPMPGDTPGFRAPRYTSIGVGTATFIIDFIIPEWIGVNQARLRGEIDWDVRWAVTIEVSAEEDPGEDTFISIAGFMLYAVEQTAFRPPNPPPFADAGADQTVPRGLEVILNGSRTYDYYNAGFDVTSEDVFEKDTLTFTWEWISGPIRVDPVPYPAGDSHSPIAIVTLNVPNDPDDPNDVYVYRLTVDDNVNALPSTDSVRIRVLDELPPKTPPRAVIEGPANPQPVGAIITLVSRSTDPDRPDDPNGILLDYRWQQTNELGGPLAPEELQNTFVPLSGQTEKKSTWQALTPGTFYFRLLVSDGDFLANATFSVAVFEPETSGATATADEPPSDDGSGLNDASEQGEPASPSLCGAGMLPVAVVPLALCVWRRRGR
jgi:hypothetical protein